MLLFEAIKKQLNRWHVVVALLPACLLVKVHTHYLLMVVLTLSVVSQL